MNGYIYDFLSVFFDKITDIKKVKSLILFGSFARGNQRKDSDIDLFVDVEDKNKPEIEELVRESVNEFEVKASKSWYLKGIKNPIRPIVGNLNKEQWKELRSEISKYGITLFGKSHLETAGKGKHSALIEYNISKLRQSNKMKLLRKLYGYNIMKGKKIYSQKGLSSKIKLEKLSSALFVDFMEANEILGLLKSEKIPFKIREVWLE